MAGVFRAVQKGEIILKGNLAICVAMMLAVCGCAGLTTPDQDIQAAFGALKAGRLDESLQIDNAALARTDLTPIQRVNLYKVRCIIYAIKGKPDLALTDTDAAIQINPNDGELHHNRASFLAQLGRLDEAVVEMDKAIGLVPNNSDNFTQRAAYNLRIGSYEAALKDLDEALFLKKDNALAFYNLGQTHFTVGRYREAVEDFSQDLRLRPTNVWTVLWLHLARLKAGDSDADEFNGNIKPIDLTKWPGPLIKLFLGQLNPDELRIAEANDPTLAKDPPDCIVNLLVGEYELSRNHTDVARHSLQDASTGCTNNAYFRDIALVDLKRLSGRSPL